MEKTIAYKYDSIPKDMELEDVLEIYHATGVLVYEGDKPYEIGSGNVNQDIVFISYKEWLNSSYVTH